MMTQIILVSNGNTPWDKDKIFQGSKDIPLDDLGREEAWAAGKWLKDKNIHAVYTSPLSRARDTAIAIARHHDLKVLDLPGLADLSYGEWDGVPLKEVKVKYADLYRQWEAPPRPDGAVRGPPGGEQGADIRIHRPVQLPLLAHRPGHYCHQSLSSGGRRPKSGKNLAHYFH
jgi:phosphoserine phosphatase